MPRFLTVSRCLIVEAIAGCLLAALSQVILAPKAPNWNREPNDSAARIRGDVSIPKEG